MRVYVVAASLLSLPAVAADSSSLCQPSEVVYFSCNTKGGKQVSICGSAFQLEAERVDRVRFNEGYLQYRFGTKQQLEKLYPMNRRGSVEKFAGTYFAPAGAASASLSFSTGDYMYSVGISGGPGVEAFTGVSVTRSFKTVARHSCVNEPTLETRNRIGFIELAQLLAK